MNIEIWIVVWKVTFIIGIALFIGMAVWVSVQGFKDIKSLLKATESQEN